MTKPIPGRCFCGTIRFELIPPTEFVSHCHCEDCRRSHGSAFVTWTAVPKDRFHWLAGEERLKKHESHPGVRWGFCSECGTSFFYDCDDSPQKVYVTVSSLESSPDRLPDCHVSFEERMEWLKISDGLPKFRGKTDVVMEA
jgi:hypothetical protein